MKIKLLSRIDFVLIFLVTSLIFIGLVAVYSATYSAELDSSTYFSRQITFGFIGIVLMLFTGFVPYKLVQKSSLFLYGFSILLLILVYFVGVKGFGAERWLALGSIKVQPSEFAKLATILMVAWYLSRPEVNINKFSHLAIVLGIILLPFILIARQPDLGTSLVFLAILIPILFWAGLNWFVLFVMVAPLLTAILSFNFYAFLFWMFFISAVLLLSKRKPLILIIIFLMHISVGLITPVMWNQLRPYQQQRILTFANPEADPRGAGYQIIQSKVAIGSGGIWGKGFLNGSQTQLKFLPAQHTDFIFSVIGEEWGLMGVLFVLFVFILLLLYLLYLSSQMRSVYTSISIIGITTILFFHIVINIGMTVGLAPVTGLPLPFISYGGSFLMAIMLMMGVVLNFSINRYQN